MEIIAHRGCSRKYGDNTMEAFKFACDLKCGIELDCQITMDKVIICSHNPFCKQSGTMTFERNYNEKVDVALEDVFLEVTTKCFFIDIKDTRSESDVVSYLVNISRANGMIDKCVFASFNEFHLRDLCEEEKKMGRIFNKAYITGNLHVDWFESKIRTWGISHIIIYKFQINKPLVTFLKKQNVKVFVYTCNTPGTFSYCEECECDGIISDIPEYFLS